MSAKIFPPAEARLLEIWEYTVTNWGEDQADRYIQDLIGAINRLAKQRPLWKSVGDKQLSGVWFARWRQHLVFFRELKGGVIGVISILHESMDMPERLKEDAQKIV